jgi:hypothetical protein
MKRGFGKTCGFCGEVALGLIDESSCAMAFLSTRVVEFRTTLCLLRFGAVGWASFTMACSKTSLTNS